MRVKPREHAADSLCDELLVFNGLYIMGLDGAIDIGKLAQLFYRKRHPAIALGDSRNTYTDQQSADHSDGYPAYRFQT